MTLLDLGVIGTSAKENEYRLPLHPEHIPGLDADLRERITLEHGYGERFGIADADLADVVAGFASREEILAGSDVVLLPKPQHADVALLREGAVLWGWPHCVQDPGLTQLAIDRRLTLIAFEVMNHWTRDGNVGLHVFHKNNELAGYCSVLQALQLTGRTGDYGRRLRAVVIGFGATARGAVTALNAHGIHDVCVLTSRGVAAVGSPIHSVRILQFDQDPDGAAAQPRDHRARPGPDRAVPGRARHRRQLHLPGHLGPADLPAPPTTSPRSGPRSLIVDVSCDEGMGFEWARPTGFDDPMFAVGNVDYYGGRPQPVVPLGVGDVGEQPGADPVPAAGARGPRVVGRRRDAEPGDRDPRRARSSTRTSSPSRDARPSTRTRWPETP